LSMLLWTVGALIFVASPSTTSTIPRHRELDCDGVSTRAVAGQGGHLVKYFVAAFTFDAVARPSAPAWWT
jgi:hypothetical protein